MKTICHTAAATLAVVVLSLVLTAPASATTVPPGGTAAGEDSQPSDCAGVDAAAIAELSVHEAAVELEELSMLTAAISASSLDDQLAGDGPFTIFAPANSAFEKIPAEDLEAVLADPQGALTDILTRHVVQGEQLSSVDLAEMGSVETLNGELTFEMDGDALTIDGGAATVVCADVPTANATVHIIDTVLMPAS